MKKGLLLLTLTALLPSVLAFNCKTLGGGDLYICQEIQSSNLTSYEKDLLISDIFNKNKTTPNFDFVYSWNTNLNISSPSDGKTYSSGTINSAWIEIVSVLPSILDNNTLYSSDKGKLLTVYGYKYGSLPSKTEKKDCKTIYSWDTKSAYLQIYLNNKIIGSESLLAYQLYDKTENLSFKAELTITGKYKVEHYRQKWVDGYRKCVYYSKEYRTDTLKVNDTLQVKRYENELNFSFKILNEYSNITKGIISAENYSNLILSFNNSKLQSKKYVYSFNYTLPYYILTIKADKIDEFSSNNIFVEKDNNNFTFTVKDSSNCQIELYDHFNSKIGNCDMSFNEIKFEIKTDKTNYYENDTIKVFITPSDVLLNLTYGNKSKLVKNYAEFKAVLYQNKIYSKLNDEEIITLVNVNSLENRKTFLELLTLFIVCYLLYKSIKSYLLRKL